jgi:hypothetical protein
VNRLVIPLVVDNAIGCQANLHDVYSSGLNTRRAGLGQKLRISVFATVGRNQCARHGEPPGLRGIIGDRLPDEAASLTVHDRLRLATYEIPLGNYSTVWIWREAPGWH